jgi:outer membrane protein TolC
MFTRALLAAVCALAAAFSVSGEARILDENAAVELALRADVSVAAQRLDLEGKERKAASRNNVFLPSLAASAIGRENYAESKTGDFAGTLTTALRAASSLSLSAAALQAGTTAEAEASAARIQARAATEKSEKETRKAFYKLILLREQRKVAESAVEVAKGSRDRTAEEYRNGLASELTKRKSDINYETARLALARKRAEYETAAAAFSVRLGLRDKEWDLSGNLDFPAIDLSALSSGATDLGARTDVAIALAQTAVQESKIEEERRALRFPTLSLGAQYDWTRTGEADFAPSAQVSVTLSSPNLSAFLPFSDKSVALQASQGTLRKLRLQADETARNAALEVQTLLRTLSVSAAAVASLAESVELAREVVRLTREAYAVGSASYQELKDVEKEADDARVGLLSERYTYLSALIDLEYATGKQLRPKKERP